MNKLIMALVVLLWALPLRAEVSATVDQNPVVQGQAVTLTIRVVDEKGEPDLTPLEKDFRVLGQSTSSQVQYINGSVSKWKDWSVQLLPRREGDLTVPAIPVGKVSTQPFTLKVIKQASSGPREAWVDFEVEPKTVWQGQQVLVTVELYYASSVRSGELSAPDVGNAVIEQIGEDQTEQTVKNGVRYNRLTRRYVLFPEQPGALRISGPVFNGQAEAARTPSRSFGGLFRSTRHITAAGDDVDITVEAAPIGSDFWIPAQDVNLIADWVDDAGNTTPEFRVGEPVTRVVALTAYGLLATQLPNLEFDYAGLRAYPEAPEQETRGSTQGVVGIRRYSTAVIPQSPGTFTLPAQVVKWWDVNRGEWAEAKLAAETIEVLPATGSAVVASQPAEPCEPVVLPATTAEEPIAACTEAADEGNKQTTFWPWLFAAALGLWLLTLLAWWRSVKTVKVPDKKSTQTAVAQAKTAAIVACKSNNPQQAARAVADLAKAAGLATTAPAAVAKQCGDGVLAHALQELDSALYGSSKQWNGKVLATALKQSHWAQAEKATQAGGLPPMYPH